MFGVGDGTGSEEMGKGWKEESGIIATRYFDGIEEPIL